MQPSSSKTPPLSSSDAAPASSPGRQAAATTTVHNGAAPKRWRGKLHAAVDAFSKASSPASAARSPAAAPTPRPAEPGTGPGRWLTGDSRLSEIHTAIRQSAAGHPSPTWIASKPVAGHNPNNFNGQMRIVRQASGVVNDADLEPAKVNVSAKRAVSRVAALWRGVRGKPATKPGKTAPPSGAEPAPPAAERAAFPTPGR